MQVKGTDYHITQGRDGLIYTNFANQNTWLPVDQNNQVAIDASQEMLSYLRQARKLETREIINKFNQLKPLIVAGITLPDDVTPTTSVDKSLLMTSLIAFMSEFHFEPNFRFVNTLAWANQRGEAKEYVRNYFAMIDSPYVNSISEKMNSSEFKRILSDLTECGTPTSTINKRFKIYYGSQGTGKTTKAIEEAEECMVCHSALLPQDLMEDFKFVDGKPQFEPSALQRAMTEGKKIVLDEINLLPFESLRFLQSILDGKSEFEYKGKTIQVADGFEIIGTMNLVVNGCTYALPEPLVDRASDLKEFKLTANDLVAALS